MGRTVQRPAADHRQRRSGLRPRRATGAGPWWKATWATMRYALAGNGGTVATWTFSGVTPGWYRVAATWTAGANRIADAQFAVYDVADDGTLSPRHRPGRRRDHRASIRSTSGWPPTISAPTGAAWEELTDGTPLYFFVTGHEAAGATVQPERGDHPPVRHGRRRADRTDQRGRPDRRPGPARAAAGGRHAARTGDPDPGRRAGRARN